MSIAAWKASADAYRACAATSAGAVALGLFNGLTAACKDADPASVPGTREASEE